VDHFHSYSELEITLMAKDKDILDTGKDVLDKTPKGVAKTARRKGLHQSKKSRKAITKG